MGKRKSSPRLATTSSNDVVNLYYVHNTTIYTVQFIKQYQFCIRSVIIILTLVEG